MNKLVLQIVALIILFFSTWFVLKQIDWMKIFKIEIISNSAEEKLGNLIWKMIQETEEINNDPFVVQSVDSIVDKICLKNKIEREFIKVHIIHKDEINAFALPYGHIIVYTGLIQETDHQGALGGVIAHEIAHITENHVIKKLIKEVGISVLFDMTTNNSSVKIGKEVGNVLSSTAFDRKLEKEADKIALLYLKNANIDPTYLSKFLFKLAESESDLTKYSTWFNTHPNTKERALIIQKQVRKENTTYNNVIQTQTWENLKSKIL